MALVVVSSYYTKFLIFSQKDFMNYKKSFLKKFQKISIKHNAVSNFDRFLIKINSFGETIADLNQFLTDFCLKYNIATYCTGNDIIFNTVNGKD